MYKFKNEILSGLLIISGILNAQSIKWGHESTSSIPIRGIIGSDDQGFYILRYTRDGSHYGDKSMKDVTIEKYDYSDKQLYTKNIEITETEGKGKKLLIDTVLYLKDNMVAIAYANDSKDAYAIKISKDGSVDANKTLIGSVDPSSIVSQNSLLAPNRYCVLVSKDKTKLMAYYVKAKQKKITVKMMDENLAEQWNQEINPPVTGDFNFIEPITDGTKAYFLISEEKEKHKVTYSLIRYDKGSNSTKKIELNPDNHKLVESFNLDISSAGDVWFTGFYENESGDGVRGCFIMDVDNSGQVKLNKSAELSTDFLTKFVTQKKVEKGKGVENVNMRNAVIMPDGSVILMAEQFKGSPFYRTPDMAARSNMNDLNPAHREFAMTNVEAENRYKDGIFVKMTSDGAIVWNDDIIKDENHNTTSLAKLVCPYGYFLSGTMLYIVYNDNRRYTIKSQEDMAKEKDDVKMTWLDAIPSDWALSVASIDLASGATQKKQIPGEYEKNKAIIYTDLITQSGDNVIVYRSDGKKAQLGQFVIK